MKKISKKDLQGLSRLFPVLEKEEMRRYVGGYSDNYFSGGMGYSWDNYGDITTGSGGYSGGSYSESNPYFDYWLNSGTYYTDSYGNFFWYSGGTKPDYYTPDQYDSMVANGTWNGGFVEGWGYVRKDINAYSGNGDYYTFPDYLRSSSSSAWEYFVAKVIDEAFGRNPITSGLNEYRNYMEDRINSINNEMQAELLEKGYDRSANLFVGSKPIIDGTNSKVRFSVYNTDTGELILSKDMNIVGYY